GYRIRDRNVRCPMGELDVVAEQGGTIVFVEVKTRTTADFGAPFDAITPAKRRRLWRLATYYLITRRLGDRPCRFDAVSVLVTPQGRVVRVEVLAGAFEVDDT
ncbi:MAG: YraN family protein, partial [Armatimonadota bacterium]|nr:YraN family protein [Armatimonadota bacterium]MDR7436742.1 YraN family protein [Armatimonadota bacterium]MDR7508173.1 YraN family protein [Armatimonadota bacterium]